jgi:hypothetical protein
MELASMLAGETFTDRPRSVCPVVAAFLRVYNDTIDDRRRQDLRRFASLAVGTRRGDEVEAQRGNLCVAWGRELLDGGKRPRLRRRALRPPKENVPLRSGAVAELTARLAAREVSMRISARRADEAHAAALAFLERLIAAGDEGDHRADETPPADRERLVTV